MLKVGDKVKDFTLLDFNGKSHTLSNHLGKKVVVYFYPKDNTPGCTKQACDFRDNFHEIKSKNVVLIGISPDGKCQVSYLYENDKPVEVQTIVVSAQTKCSIDPILLERIIKDDLLKPLIGSLDGINILVNPTGEFSIGGPDADAGLTGRKIIVDTYGGFSHHGGGAFSGKDTSKGDRSAAYYARYAAKSFVDAGLADRCEIGVAYSIGVAEPVSLYIDTFGTGKLSDEDLLYLLKVYFDFTPSNIRKELELDKVKFSSLSAFGHVGRDDLNVKWEDTKSKANELKEAYGKAKRTAQVL